MVENGIAIERRKFSRVESNFEIDEFPVQYEIIILLANRIVFYNQHKSFYHNSVVETKTLTFSQCNQ